MALPFLEINSEIDTVVIGCSNIIIPTDLYKSLPNFSVGLRIVPSEVVYRRTLPGFATTAPLISLKSTVSDVHIVPLKSTVSDVHNANISPVKY